jgi:hypothetical protein
MRTAQYADTSGVGATAMSASVCTARERATRRLAFTENGPRPDPAATCRQAFLIERNCKASRLRRKRSGGLESRASDNFVNVWRRSHAYDALARAVAGKRPMTYQDLRATASRISRHDGQRSSPSGVWARSFIGCESADAVAGREAMPSDIAGARLTTSSRSARTSLIQSSLGLRIVINDRRLENYVASLASDAAA